MHPHIPVRHVPHLVRLSRLGKVHVDGVRAEGRREFFESPRDDAGVLTEAVEDENSQGVVLCGFPRGCIGRRRKDRSDPGDVGVLGEEEDFRRSAIPF